MAPILALLPEIGAAAGTAGGLTAAGTTAATALPELGSLLLPEILGTAGVGTGAGAMLPTAGLVGSGMGAFAPAMQGLMGAGLATAPNTAMSLPGLLKGMSAANMGMNMMNPNKNQMQQPQAPAPHRAQPQQQPQYAAQQPNPYLLYLLKKKMMQGGK